MIINKALPLSATSTLRATFYSIVTIAVVMFMAFWLSACSVSPSSTPQSQTPAQIDATISDEKTDPLTYQGCVYPADDIVQACTVQGGEFSKQGMLGCYSCVVSYDDAGKACQDSSDCQGVCSSTGEFVDSGTTNQTGQCSLDSSPFGCRQLLEKGVAQPAICVD